MTREQSSTLSSQLLCEARENGMLFASVRAPVRLVEETEDYKLYNVQGSLFELDSHYELLMGIGFGAYGVVCAAADLRLVYNTNNNNNSNTDYSNINTDNRYYNDCLVEVERHGNVLIRYREEPCYSDWQKAISNTRNNTDNVVCNNNNSSSRSSNNGNNYVNKKQGQYKWLYYKVAKFTVSIDEDYSDIEHTKATIKEREEREYEEQQLSYNIQNLENTNDKRKRWLDYKHEEEQYCNRNHREQQQEQQQQQPASPFLIVPTLEYEPFLRRSLRLKGSSSNSNDNKRISWSSPFVAIKKIAKLFDDLIDARRVLREIKTLRYLRGHPNIVRLLDVSCKPSLLHTCEGKEKLLDTDLGTLMRSSHALDEEQICYICYQIIRSLVYIHSSSIIHRDIKPGNILVNGDCQVKLCDFGLARGGVPWCCNTAKQMTSSHVYHRPTQHDDKTEKEKRLTSEKECINNNDNNCKKTWDQDTLSEFDMYRFRADTMQRSFHVTSGNDRLKLEKQEEEEEELEETCFSKAQSNYVIDSCVKQAHMYSLTDYVVTRYYRAPELLIMGKYNHAVDMWAVGCILGEMILRRPLFMGVNYLTQLSLILQTPGLRGLPNSPEALDAMFDGGEEGKWFIKNMLFSQYCLHSEEMEWQAWRERSFANHTQSNSNVHTNNKLADSAILINKTNSFTTNTPLSMNARCKSHSLPNLPSHFASSRASSLTYSHGNIALMRSTLFNSQHVSANAMMLLSRLLSFNPHDRPSALEALQHPYFAKLYNPREVIIRDLENDVTTLMAEPTFSSEQEQQQEQQEQQQYLQKQRYLTLVKDEDVKQEQQELHYVIEEVAKPYLWAFDHHVATRDGLQALFREEIAYYADVKRQLQNIKEQSMY